MNMMMKEGPMRVLMVLHLPWDRHLGGARVQLELAEALAAAGHHVGRFCLTDAFPHAPRTRWGHLVREPFSRRAERFVRENGGAYDVVDALEGCLTVAKESLSFSGLLVARSIGLGRLYEARLRDSQSAFWAGSPMGKPLVRQLRDWRSAQFLRGCDASFRHADLANVCNVDELRFARERLGVPHERGLVLPFGLHDPRRAAFATARAATASKAPVVATVGFWDRRKGAFEWPEILRAVHRRRADVRFRFLGTGFSQDSVRRALGYGADDRVEVIPKFASDDLPRLLATAQLGAFPSHVEGFPFGVLEMLAAGLPVVAYDAPGARETVPRLDPDLLTPVGDPAAFAGQLLRLLDDAGERARLGSRAREIADAYAWSEIAARTAAEYAARMSPTPTVRHPAAAASSVHRRNRTKFTSR
jgi:glycosyltransferase involved in cell wall biosynthesis